MLDKIKIIGLFIGLIALAIISFVFGRRSNGSGVPDDNGLSDRIGQGIDSSTERNNESQETVKRIQDGIDKASDSANRTGDRIGNAQDKLRTAIELLRNAKKTG